jgi:hypothetical protein
VSLPLTSCLPDEQSFGYLQAEHNTNFLRTNVLYFQLSFFFFIFIFLSGWWLRRLRCFKGPGNDAEHPATTVCENVLEAVQWIINRA